MNRPSAAATRAVDMIGRSGALAARPLRLAATD
jgi:hypothetical protein